MSTPARTSPLGFRVGPQLHYVLKLAARERKVSLSTFVEQTLTSALLRPENTPQPDSSLAYVPGNWDALWDDDEAMRFLLLATNRPDLLTPDERRVWNVLTNSLGVTFKPSEFIAAYNKAGVMKGGE